MVRLELLYSARNATEFTSLREDLDALPNCPIGVVERKRALEVYEALARQGGLHHRSVRHPDLLVAAAAEAAGLSVVHYDEDYDRIASVTGQDVRWLAPRGSLS
jgi:predicted nucleic acid-binding protein